MGLAFDEWDLDYYTTMFRDELKRDPTNVELFDIAQSNSEHSRCAGSGACSTCTQQQGLVDIGGCELLWNWCSQPVCWRQPN